MPDLADTVSSACDACTLADASQRPHVSLQSTGEFFVNLLNTSGFPPRWECGTAWTPGHGWLHITADFAIFGAYMAIPVVLAFFILRRNDIPFPPILWLFVAFIALCGIGHLIEGTIFWVPWYRLSGLVKGMTAVVSWVTVLALIRIVPSALALPGLAVANQHLQQEVAERKTAEEKLRQSYDELQNFSRNALDREDRLIELKKEVNTLLVELGRETRYST